MQSLRPAVPYGMLQKMSTLPPGSKRLEVTASMPRAPHFHHFQFSYVPYLAALPLAQLDWKPTAGKQMPISSVSTSLIFSQPSLSLGNYMSPEHCSEHSPSACTVWEFTANSFHTEEAAPCKEADSKAMTTTWNQHSRDLFVIICGYTFMTTHSTSSIHMVLSCSALNSAH